MGHTRPVSETILQRAKGDAEFRAALLAEAVELITDNDIPTAKSIIRKYILASLGFTVLAKQVGKKPESLMRMLSEKGNPTMKNMAVLLATLQRHEGIELHVKATR
jgi:DNA-binding phage protein